jgi:hypothetical protein
MPLSWNEIKDRALNFSKEWADTSNEDAEAKPFLVDFFDVFGISRKRVATFEHRVKKLDDSDGYIDLIWKGTILIEMKSKGKNLDKAFQQSLDYTHGLKQHELPKFILISDFENFHLYDLEDDTITKFKLHELVNNVHHFGYLLGYQKKVYKEQDPANIKAAELMGKLHDRLKEIGYTGHPLEVYLVRILFCLFAEDTTIFNKQQFQDFIEQRTNIDGSDLASKLQELFQVLNTPKDKRFKNLDEQLADFPYVNGKLFEENLPTASFDSNMRQALLNCSYIDWSKISPAIFGSMFQSIMNPVERRNLGAHYTSETNILKLIKPLFLDDLWKEFESIKDNKNKLSEFHKKLSSLKFLDPACGCGNFLVITYRELRLLEIEILRQLYKNQLTTSIENIVWLNVDQFYGIEIEEFPARIAEVAMWLIDHQMNMLFSNEFGQYFVRLPLKKAAQIFNDNALSLDWNSLLKSDEINLEANSTIIKLSEPEFQYASVNIKTKNLTIIDERGKEPILKELNLRFNYILGNPPFIGKQEQSPRQKQDMENAFVNFKTTGVLDYVAAWYIKAAQYILNTTTKVAFVSTNSITQGEQVAVLWNILFHQFNLKIHFAHRTFKWSNEASGKAAVHCVIIGIANFNTNNKIIFEYTDIKGEPHQVKAKNINPYLVDAKDLLLVKRSKPICEVPEISFGSMPNDGGSFLLSDAEKNELILREPNAAKFIKPLISAEEFINGINRWCLWLKDANPSELKNLKYVSEKILNVQKIRSQSKRPTTQKLANFPTLFGEDRQPNSEYILIPLTSSENRKYIPLGFFSKEYIVTNSCSVIANASLFHFGILSSAMHMAWVKYTCGRLESRIRYSNTIVYNNFPWPNSPNDKQIKAIESAAQKVLDTRLQFPNSSLADLYDPLTMPPPLIKAHNELDKAVDLAYRPQPFTKEANRMEFLFNLYEKYTATIFTKPKKSKKT